MKKGRDDANLWMKKESRVWIAYVPAATSCALERTRSARSNGSRERRKEPGIYSGWGRTCREERNFIGNRHQCHACVPVSWRYSTWPVASFFLPFFYDFRGILPSGNADGEAKIGSGAPKSDAALSQDIHRILNSFTLLPLRSYNDRSRSQ